MAKRTARRRPQRQEVDLTLPDYDGVNSFGIHSALSATELRECTNFDLYPGYLKSRRGSVGHSTSSSFNDEPANENIINGISWVTHSTGLGELEYIILQVAVGSTSYLFKELVPPASGQGYVTALDQVTPIDLGSKEPADFKISGDKILVFHPEGNWVVLDKFGGSTVIVALPMGLEKPFISTVAAYNPGNLTGLYTYGVELVYQIDGVDMVASTPCRKTSAGKLLSVTLSANGVRVTVDSASLPAAPGDYWTHVRLWRSLNQNTDISDPLNPKDAAGLPSELYPVKLVSKFDLVAQSYIIYDNLADADLPGDLTSEYPVLTIKQIELVPLPAAYTGAYHRGRIWVTRAQGVNDTTESAVYYTNSAGDAYAQQYDPLNVLRAERGDGQKSVKLIPFDADLIVLKEAKTLRIPDGDPAAGMEVIDANIGVSHARLAHFVPKLGICAITSDQSDLRILGYDLRWTNILGGRDISRPIRTETAAMAAAPDQVSMFYANGKLIVSDGTGIMYALHVKEGKGWGRYLYPITNTALVLVVSNGARVLVAPNTRYLVEIEKDGVDTDYDVDNAVTIAIPLSLTTPIFQSKSGRNVLEMTWLSIVGLLSNRLYAIPYANSYPWPRKTEEDQTEFTVDTRAYDEGDAGLEREWKLYLESRPIAPFIHFKLLTYGPATLRDALLRAIVDEAGMGAGYFDPFITLTDEQAQPLWASGSLLDASPGARTTSEMDEYDALEGARDTSTMTELERP